MHPKVLLDSRWIEASPHNYNLLRHEQLRRRRGKVAMYRRNVHVTCTILFVPCQSTRIVSQESHTLNTSRPPHSQQYLSEASRCFPASSAAMSDDRNPMTESGVTMTSDSEQYSAPDLSTSPPESSSPAIVLYQPPTLWSMVRGIAINLVLPFINGMMLGFGELLAHEAAFRFGWGGTRVGDFSPILATIPSTQG